MERVSKEAHLRKNEIVDAARELFYQNGFYKTSVSEIARKVGIAKGTIYHHFSSKEEILDAIITQLVQNLINEAGEIATVPNKSAVQKFNEMISANFRYIMENYVTVNQIHGIDNVNMREKLIVKIVSLYVPILADIIKQGNKEGVFDCKNSLELMEFVIIISHMSFDRGVFNLSYEDAARKAEVLQNIIETMLNVKKGTFDTVSKMLREISLTVKIDTESKTNI